MNNKLHIFIFIYALALCLASEETSSQTVNWESVGSTGLTSVAMEPLAVSDQGSVFYLGLLRSEDTGDSWDQIAGGQHTIASGNDGRMYTATNGEILSSSDNGATWTSSGILGEASFIYDILQGADGSLYASANVGLYKSEDNAQTWTTIDTSRELSSIAEGADGILFCARARITIPFGGVEREAGVFRSSDNGQTWQETSLADTAMLSARVVSPAPGVVLAGASFLEGRGRVFHSTDNGSSWTQTSVRDVVTSFSVAPNGDVYATAANTGVYRSTDAGATWSQQNSGLSDSRIFGIVLDPHTGRLFSVDVFGTLYRSTEPVVSSTPTTMAFEVALDIAPNPASAIATIEFRIPQPAYAQVDIIDNAGRKVVEFFRGFVPAAEQRLQLQTSTLIPGAYAVRIRSQGFSAMRRFVIAR